MTLDELDNRDLLPGDPDAPVPAAPGDRAAPPRTPAVRPGRADDLRLARLHLRMGSLALARAELEASHADLPLSGTALLDLAEARWRTGDLAAAGQAADAWLEAPGEASGVLARVMAVEAALAGGRPSDAREHHERVATLTAAELEAIFNGMPRGVLWPAPEGSSQTPWGASQPHAGKAGGPVRGSAASAGSAPRSTPGVGAPAFARGAGQAAGAPAPRIDAVAELDAARADLESGSDAGASVRLAVVLRLAPHLAPAVLDLVDGAGGPLIELVRGDAYRLVGRGVEAERAWRAAAAQLPGDDAARQRRAASGPRTAPYAAPAGAVPAAADLDPSNPGAPAPEGASRPEETP